MASLSSCLLFLVFCIVVIDSHTWIQCTDYKTDGTCNGFIRNYFARNVPGGGSTDEFYTNKVLGQDPNFLVCKSDTQATPTYSNQFPKATAKAGSTLKTMYTPNGHSDPGDEGRSTFARIHWNRGPNGPTGQLKFRKDINSTNEMSRANYADNCATTGDVASLPCVNSYTIPRDTPPGTYQFVWYWPYNKNANQRPFGEEYFSCFEIDVLAADANIASSAPRASSASRASTSASRASTSASRASTSASKAASSAQRQSSSEEDSTNEETQTETNTDNNNVGQGDFDSSSSKWTLSLLLMSLYFF